MRGGLFISLEGPDGAGKSTLGAELARRLRQQGHRVTLTYEPGGTPLGQRIRETLHHGVGAEPEAALAADGSSTPDAGDRSRQGATMGALPVEQVIDRLTLVDRAETLLFCAARAQLVETVIQPALTAGEVVVCDRFADSTLAYQCRGRGLPIGPVREVLEFAVDGTWPDLTLLLDLDVASGLRRKRQDGGDAPVDRFESEAIAFHERVRRGYRELATAEPERWVVLDADRSAAAVAEVAWAVVTRRLAEREAAVARAE